MIKIRFKTYKDLGIFKKKEVAILEGILIGCFGYEVYDYVKIWYNKQIFNVKDEDIVGVSEG